MAGHGRSTSLPSQNFARHKSPSQKAHRPFTCQHCRVDQLRASDRYAIALGPLSRVDAPVNILATTCWARDGPQMNLDYAKNVTACLECANTCTSLLSCIIAIRHHALCLGGKHGEQHCNAAGVNYSRSRALREQLVAPPLDLSLYIGHFAPLCHTTGKLQVCLSYTCLSRSSRSTLHACGQHGISVTSPPWMHQELPQPAGTARTPMATRSPLPMQINLTVKLLLAHGDPTGRRLSHGKPKILLYQNCGSRKCTSPAFCDSCFLVGLTLEGSWVTSSLQATSHSRAYPRVRCVVADVAPPHGHVCVIRLRV